MKLSILTPILPEMSNHFQETAESVLDAFSNLDSSIQAEWIIVADGPGEVEVPDDSRIIF